VTEMTIEERFDWIRKESSLSLTQSLTQKIHLEVIQAEFNNLRAENKLLNSYLKDDVETDAYIRNKALEVLPESEVHGDNSGVPLLEDVFDSLVEQNKGLKKKNAQLQRETASTRHKKKWLRWRR